MKLETLEHFLNKEQELWNREDIDKLTGKYGKRAIFYDTEGLSNRLVNLFKFREKAETDEIISGFMSGENKNYSYIIEFLMEYVDYIDFVFWPSEMALQVIYKILCERIISDESLKEFSEEYIKLKQLAHKISLIRYYWYMKSEKEKGETKNE